MQLCLSLSIVVVLLLHSQLYSGVHILWNFYPRRRNVTTSLVGLKMVIYAKNLTGNGEPQRYSWGTQKKKKVNFFAYVTVLYSNGRGSHIWSSWIESVVHCPSNLQSVSQGQIFSDSWHDATERQKLLIKSVCSLTQSQYYWHRSKQS